MLWKSLGSFRKFSATFGNSEILGNSEGVKKCSGRFLNNFESFWKSSVMIFGKSSEIIGNVVKVCIFVGVVLTWSTTYVLEELIRILLVFDESNKYDATFNKLLVVFFNNSSWTGGVSPSRKLRVMKIMVKLRVKVKDMSKFKVKSYPDWAFSVSKSLEGGWNPPPLHYFPIIQWIATQLGRINNWMMIYKLIP